MKGSNCAAQTLAMSVLQTTKRRINRPRGWLRPGRSRNQSRPTTTQVSRMISGAPVSICMDPTSAPAAMRRPPSRQARSSASTTHGIQARAARLFGHISACSVSPFQAKARPATAAAKRLSVQRKANAYMPAAARNRCASMNRFSDHGSGRSR